MTGRLIDGYDLVSLCPGFAPVSVCVFFFWIFVNQRHTRFSFFVLKKRPPRCSRSARARCCQRSWWRIPIRSLYDHASKQSNQSLRCKCSYARTCSRNPFSSRFVDSWSLNLRRPPFQSHAAILSRWRIIRSQDRGNSVFSPIIPTRTSIFAKKRSRKLH